MTFECDTHMPFTEMCRSAGRNNKREEQSDEEVITIYMGNDPEYSNTLMSMMDVDIIV